MRKYCLFIILFLVKQSVGSAADTCTLKASFFPSRDTVVVANYSATFTNTTLGATAFTWLQDGNKAVTTNNFSYFTNNAGVNEVALAVSYGACVDTARMYIVVTGTPPATRDYYKMGLNVPGIESQARSVEKIGNAEYAVGGYLNYPVSEFVKQKKGFLAAIGDDGCVRWSKQSTGTDEHTITHIKKTANGDIIAGVDAQLIMRLDINGNIKWVKSLPKTGALFTSFNEISIDNDDNIVVLYSSLNAQSVVKLDGSGNIIWARNYRYGDFWSVVPRSMVHVNNSYYICGGLLLNRTGNATNESYVAKIDAVTGATQWIKTYTGSTSIFMDQVLFYNNQLIVTGQGYSVDPTVWVGSYNSPGTVYLDLDGNVVKGFWIHEFISNENLKLDVLMTRLIPLPGGDLLWFIKSKGFVPENYDKQYSSYLRIHNDNQFTWQHNIFNSSNDEFFTATAGKNESLLSAGKGVTSFTGATANPTDATLIKIASNGDFSQACDAVPTTYTLETAVTSSSPGSWESESAAVLTMNNVPFIFEDLFIQRKWVCPVAVDSCSLLKIKGPTAICDMNKEYTYRIHKTGGCATTTTIGSGIMVKTITDSSITVSFTKAGLRTILKTSLTGTCVGLTDSINITVAAGSIDIMADATVCSSDSVEFTLPEGYSGFTVFPQINLSSTSTASRIVVRPQSNTIYTFSLQRSNGCDLVDTAVITLHPVNTLNLGNDTTLCKNQPLTLNTANIVYTRYQWSDGTNGTQIKISGKGSTWLKVTDRNNCVYADTIIIKDVRKLPVLSIRQDSVLCNGKTITLNAPPSMQKVVWQDGSTGNSFGITKPGKYWVTVTDSFQCTNSDTLSIDRTVPAPVRFLTTDSSICRFDSITLRSSIAFEKYLWNNGSSLPAFTTNMAGNYSLTVTDRFLCEWKQSVTVIVQDCRYIMYFPSGFSPNRDGLNDVFRAKPTNRPQSFHMDVYNRYGQKIFESDDVLKGWDGTIAKVPQNPDTYIWIAQYRFPGQLLKIEKGTVVLLR